MGDEQDTKTPAPPQQAPKPPVPTPEPSPIMGLQATAGNAAVTRLVGDPDSAAKELTVWLAMPNPSAHREKIFRAIMDVGPARSTLPGLFQQNAGRELEPTLQESLSEKDWWRARAYLLHGRLRAADTIALAATGWGTDEDTLNRILKIARAEFAATEADLAADYSSLAAAAAPLFQVSASSKVAGMLASELSGKDLDKARAILAFGAPRPIDDVRIATNQAGTDEAALFAALRKGDRTKLPEDWTRDYGAAADAPATLDGLLDDELSDEDLTKARKILAGTWDARAQIFAAVDGIGTDEDAIWDALGTLTEAEKTAFQTDWKAKSGVWTMLEDDLSESDLTRAEQLIFGGSDAVSLLRKLGGENGSDVVDAAKKLDAAGLATAKAEYAAVPSTFAAWLGTRCPDATHQQQLRTMITGTPAQQVRLAIEGWGTDEDYLFHVLGLLSEPQKAEVAADKALLEAMDSDLSTSDMNRARDALRKAGMNASESAADLDQRIARERSWVSETFSNTSDALDDEQRAMRSLLARAGADGKVDAAEEAVVAAQVGATEEALAVYTQVRDELEAIAANVLTTAAAIIVSVVTAGAGSGAGAAMISAQLAAQAARAALVSALVKIAATKVAKGDRFDVLGADGAMTFATGAADGVLSVFGGPITQTLINPAFRNAASAEARVVAVAAWEGAVGRRLVATTVEGGIGSGAGTLIETGANEDTWKGGLEKGFTKLATDTGTSIVQGAGTSLAQGVAKEGASAAWDKLKGPGTDGAGEPHPQGADGAGPGHAGPAGPEGAGRQGAEPTVVMRLADPAQVAGLPADLRGVVPVIVDPALTGSTVRVHYDVAADGLVAGIHLRIAPGADAITIGLHAGTVRAMQKWTGFAGRVRLLASRIEESFTLHGTPRPGTPAFEARLEVDKLKGIISERLGRLAESTDPDLDKALLGEFESLQAQLTHHQHALDDLDPLAVAARAQAPDGAAPADGATPADPAGAAPAPRGFVAADAAEQVLVDRLGAELSPGAAAGARATFTDAGVSEAVKARARSEIASVLDLASQGRVHPDDLSAALAKLEGELKTRTAAGTTPPDNVVIETLAVLRRVAAVEPQVGPGGKVLIDLTQRTAKVRGIDLAPVSEADVCWLDAAAGIHVEEVKATPAALAEKMIKKMQIANLAALQAKNPGVVIGAVIVDTEVGWTKLAWQVKGKDGKEGTLFAQLAEHGLPLQIGKRVLAPADLERLDEALTKYVDAAALELDPTVTAGKNANQIKVEVFNRIPTIKDLEKATGESFP